MAKRYRILPYRQGSKSAKSLSTVLGGKVLRLIGSIYKPRLNDTIINWGNTQPTSQVISGWYGQDETGYCKYLNPPHLVKMASNKLNFFQSLAVDALELAITPRFWTNKEEIPDDAYPIVCRTTLAGHSGDGIVIADSYGSLVPAPLYVQYVKKKDEYRIHVGKKDNDAVIISVQRKARRLDTPNEEVNWQVRNHSNGFVFVRNNVAPPDSVLEVSKKALLAVGLDFGAVDVIWNEQQQKAYVLEINTAPGLEGQTVEDYKSFFLSL